MLWLGLASTAGTIFVVLSFGQLTRHFEYLVNDEVMGRALGIAVTLSLVTTVVSIWLRKLNVRDALSHWVVGAVVGLLTVGPLMWLLFMGLMILSY